MIDTTILHDPKSHMGNQLTCFIHNLVVVFFLKSSIIYMSYLLWPGGRYKVWTQMQNTMWSKNTFSLVYFRNTEFQWRNVSEHRDWP